MPFLQRNDRRLLCQAVWPIKSRKIECSSVLRDIWYPVMQILAWDLSLSIGRKLDMFHCVAQCDNQFVILPQEDTWWNIRYKEFIQQTSKNQSFVILRNYKKSITLSLRQPHRLFWCACKSHQSWVVPQSFWGAHPWPVIGTLWLILALCIFWNDVRMLNPVVNGFDVSFVSLFLIVGTHFRIFVRRFFRPLAYEMKLLKLSFPSGIRINFLSLRSDFVSRKAILDLASFFFYVMVYFLIIWLSNMCGAS